MAVPADSAWWTSSRQPFDNRGGASPPAAADVVVGHPMIRACTSCGQKNRIGAAHLASETRCGRCKTSIGPLAEPVQADAELFEEVRQHARVPVLVDFWAAWCGPCRAAAPEVAKVAASMAGRALVLKVDTDRHPDLAGQYGVQGIPNFVVLKGGLIVHQHAGVVGHAVMEGWLERAFV